ncbi:TPA: hypothetical protein ACMDP8_003043 [Vibrio cholerae]|nr:hypothetical protein [Vibrio cholerae]
MTILIISILKPVWFSAVSNAQNITMQTTNEGKIALFAESGKTKAAATN